MTCSEVNDFLADYRGGELQPEVRRRFEEHLLVCAACVSYLRSYDEAVRLARETGGELAQQLLPHDVPESLVDAILAATTRKRPA